MKRAQAFARGVWEFVVGDDWITAAGVVVALALTALASQAGPAWFVMPLAVVALLGVSIWRAARRRRPHGRIT
jgi:lysozyme family protein